MDEKFADLVIQEIHSLGQNVSKLDRKIDIKMDMLKKESLENKKCNDKSHQDIINKLDEKTDAHLSLHFEHDKDHVLCKQDCNDKADKKIGAGWFRWITGAMAISFVSVSIAFGGFSLQLQKKLERHIYFAEYVYQEVTGQKWSDNSRESLLKAKDTFDKHMEQINNSEIDEGE